MSKLTPENLIPFTGSLKAGQRLLKLSDGSFLPVGVSEVAPAPDPTPAIAFYKCASVDTVNQTWTGYKAVLNNGVYTFESTATSGLAYTSVTPEVGKVYSADALAAATLYEGIPSDGLLLYASLASDVATCETGQAITKSGTVVFETYQGIPSAKFQGGGYLDFSPAISHLTGSNPFTLSWWEKVDSGYVWQFGTGDNDRCVGGGSWLYYNGGYIGGGTLPSDFHFCCVTYNGSTLSYYINGSANGSTSAGSPNNQNTLRLGRGAGGYYGGYLAAFRIYNRALTSAEISALASEFTPTT